MKRLMKKTISIICAVALFVTGITFMPQAVSADDVWYDLVGNWNSGVRQCEVPEGKTNIWTYEKDANTQISTANADVIKGFKWKTNTPGEACFFKTIDLKDVNCVESGSGLVKPKANTFYTLHAKIHFTPYNDSNLKADMTVETKGGLGGEDIPFTEWTVRQSSTHGNTYEQEVTGMVCIDANTDFKFCINYGFLGDKQSQKFKMCKGTIEITEFSMVEESGWSVVPSNEDYDMEGTPWTARANYNSVEPGGSYGATWYKVAEGASATDVSATTFKLKGTVGKQETYPNGDPIDNPADRWWWTSATLKGYLSKAGCTLPCNKYRGTIVLESSLATDTDCQLFVYVDGKEYPFTITAGENTLEIPTFTYKEDEQTTDDIKFLFDEMPMPAEVNVKSITFLRVDDGWSNVPNGKDNFTVGPWNAVATYLGYQPNSQTGELEDTGFYGAIQYKANKENPENYDDYDFKALSVSGWECYSSFIRLENYCSDYLDPGDKYDLTIKLNSSKATVPKGDPKKLDKLLVVVGNSEPYYFDLTAGSNTITIEDQTYGFSLTQPHEQILLGFDGLEKDTEITVTDVQIDGPNNSWTNVPNKSDTAVGAWTLFSWKDDTHWSKMAYKAKAGGSGLGAYDIKVRRTTAHPEQPFSGNASLATLTNYLTTAKDTENKNINNGDNYNVKVTIGASSVGNSIDDYGKVRLLINEQPFDFALKAGTNTYDIDKLVGDRFTYDNTKKKDVTFELDEVTAGAILNISDIQFIPTAEPGSEDVPNDQAITPEGTPWVLYAITDSATNRWGALKYKVDGDPTALSSVKINLKSVSGYWNGLSTMATLNNYFSGLKVGQRYGLRVKVNIDESNVEEQYRQVTYDKQLRVKFDNNNFDFDVVDPAQGTYTFEDVFTYAGNDNRVVFQFDQLLRGSNVYIESVELFDPPAPTTAPTTTTNPSPESSTAPGPETSGGGDVTTVDPSATTTGVVKAPGKAKIKKVYKKKRSAKKVKIKLKKVKGAVGYQVAVYKSKKKAKKNKKALVKKFTKKLKYTIKSKKLKNKKKLYLRARAYVLKADGTKLFGKWSKIKVGKVKKTSLYWPYR